METLENFIKSLKGETSFKISWNEKEKMFFLFFLLPNGDTGTAEADTIFGLLTRYFDYISRQEALEQKERQEFIDVIECLENYS